jgi:two-component system sensor histidine kinase DesK
MRLLPPNKDIGWTPYVWLVYLGFFFMQPALSRAGWKEWLATVLGAGLFLVLYFTAYWLQGRRRLWIIVAIALLGLGFAPFNGGASVFIVYAAALVPFANDSWFAAKAIATLVTAVVAEAVLLHLGLWFGITGTVLPLGAC